MLRNQYAKTRVKSRNPESFVKNPNSVSYRELIGARKIHIIPN